MFYYKVKVERFANAYGTRYEYGGMQDGFPTHVSYSPDVEWGCAKSESELGENDKVVSITEAEYLSLAKEINDIEIPKQELERALFIQTEQQKLERISALEDLLLQIGGII